MGMEVPQPGKGSLRSFLEAFNSAGVDCVHYHYPSHEIEFSVKLAHRRLSPLLSLFGFLVFLRPEGEELLLVLPTIPVSAARCPRMVIWKYMEEWDLGAMALEKGLAEEDLRRLLVLLSAPSRGIRPEMGLRAYLERSGVKGVRVTRARLDRGRSEEVVGSLRRERLAAVKKLVLEEGSLSCLEGLGDLEVVELAASLLEEGRGELLGRIIGALELNLALGGEAERRAARMFLLLERRIGKATLSSLRRGPALGGEERGKGASDRETSLVQGGEGLVGLGGGRGVGLALPVLGEGEPGGRAHQTVLIMKHGGAPTPGGTGTRPVSPGPVPVGEREDGRPARDAVASHFPGSGGPGKALLSHGNGEAAGVKAKGDPGWATRVLEGNYREETCLEALRLLVDRGGKEAEQGIGRAFRHPLPGVRAEACRLVSSVIGEEAEEALLAAARDSVPEVREAAMRAMGALKGERSWRLLVDVARDAGEEPQVRAAACGALAERGGEKAVKVIRKILERGMRRWFGEEPLQVMKAACLALAKAGGEREAELLRKLVEDREPLLREEARRALKEMRSRGIPV